MTTENEGRTDDNLQDDDADANAAFEASFEGKEVPPAKQPAEKTQAEDKDATTAADDAAAAASAAQAAASQTQDPDAKDATTEAASTASPSPKPDAAAELRAELRKVYGRLGMLTDELTKLKTVKEAEGKPAVATQVELARMKADYPELAEVLTEDLAKVLGGLAKAGADPKAIEEIVSQRVEEQVKQRMEAETARTRDALVDDAHPSWRTDLFTVDAATGVKKPSADYLAWRATLKPEQVQAFETSTNPFQVIRRLSEFYEFRGKAAKVKAEKDARLKGAVTPTGTSRAGPPQLSDREAEEKGFLEGFNS